MRKILIICSLLVIVFAAIPYVWSVQINKKIASQINEIHGENYAVIAMHCDGIPGMGINMYAKLLDYFKYKCNLFTDKYTVSIQPFAYHHCALIISNNKELFRYYWSIRKNCLIADESRVIPISNQDIYMYQSNQITQINGLNISNKVNLDAIKWYVWE